MGHLKMGAGMKLRLHLALLFVLILSLSGCVVTPQKETTVIQGLKPQSTLSFSDVPTPAGFEILPQESFILKSEGTRAGLLKYTGEAELKDVVYFYKNRMSAYNWDLLNVVEYGDLMLNFERENESCVITLKQKGTNIEILVSLSPEPPVSVSGKGIGGQEIP